MEWWLTIVYGLVNFFLLILLVLVIGQSSKSPLNRNFAYFVVATIAWSTLNLLSNFTGSFSIATLLQLNHLLLAAAILMVSLMVNFCVELLDSPQKKKIKALSLVLAGIGASLSLTPYVIDSISAQGRVIALGFGQFAWVYFLSLGLLCLFLLAFLVYAAKGKRGIERQQAIIMLSSVSVAVFFGILTNAIIPLITGDFTSTLIGPMFIVLLLGGIGYAIVKHKLFDIRLVAARSLAYLLSIVLLAVLYGVVAYSFIENILNLPETNISLRLAYTLVAILLALTFQPVKRFFDRMTDRIFFRDDYELDKITSRLGDVTVEQTDLSQLVKDSQQIFNTTLKPTYVSVLIFPKAKDGRLLYFKSGEDQLLQSDVPQRVLNLVHKASSNIITCQSQGGSVVGQFMSRYEAEVIVRLKTSSEVSGYIFFGSKRNGSIYRKKDLQLLTTAADELALAIQNALRFEEIRAFNRTLQQKVDEATARLRRTNARLRELDDAKDEFVSMASHQLRTPLTSVKGYLSMVLEGDAGELKKEQRKLLEEAYNGSQRMVYLIGDFLNVSRIKTGKFMLEFGESNLAHIIGDEVDQLRVTAENRNLNFVYEAPGSFPTVRLDENKIRQVIMNLIDNAIFYSKPGGTVKVELYTEDNQIIFRVRDNGIGVPAREQKDLFEKFYRASNARKVRPDGTGLGLFMIKKVVLAHGGTIIFSSHEDKGSTFGFTLPMSRKTAKV